MLYEYLIRPHEKSICSFCDESVLELKAQKARLAPMVPIGCTPHNFPVRIDMSYFQIKTDILITDFVLFLLIIILCIS